MSPPSSNQTKIQTKTKAHSPEAASPAPGRLILISAPSGAGKTSLVEAALEQDNNLKLSISHTTRPRRKSEVDGVNYHFTDNASFNELIAANAFVEHALVFGNQYGTSKAQIDQLTQQGCDVVLEIDWQGADQIRRLINDAVAIFILPPSLETLAARLAGRGQDSEESVQRRLSEAQLDISQAPRYQYIVINDDFDTALADLLAIIRGTRTEAGRQLAVNPQIRQLIEASAKNP